MGFLFLSFWLSMGCLNSRQLGSGGLQGEFDEVDYGTARAVSLESLLGDSGWSVPED